MKVAINFGVKLAKLTDIYGIITEIKLIGSSKPTMIRIIFNISTTKKTVI